MNCKPGDLAIIIASAFEENIGALVHVIEPGPCTLEDGPDWVIEPAGRSLIGTDTLTGQLMPSGLGIRMAALDSSLRPIRGIPESIAIPADEAAPIWA